MTLNPAFQTAAVIPIPGNPRWQYQRVTPRDRNEGDDVTFTLKCLNAIPGAKVLLWMTGGGSMGSAGNWLASWDTVVRAAVEGAGCTFQKASSTTQPTKSGTVSWIITIGPSYRTGTVMTFTNTIRKDKKNNANEVGGIRGGAGSYQILLSRVQVPNLGSSAANAAAYGTVATALPSGGGFVDVHDTSRRPEGTPTIRLQTFVPGTRTAAATNLSEGTSFDVEITTANIVGGTTLRFYAANEAQNDVTPSVRAAFPLAGRQVPGVDVFVPKWTLATAADYFNGARITFRDDYDNAQPLRFTLTVEGDTEDETTEQFDIIGILEVDGDLAEFGGGRARGDYAGNATYTVGDWVTWTNDGGTYVYTADDDGAGNPPSDTSRWRPYLRTQSLGLSTTKQFRDVPARYWELRATTDGSTITYTIQGPTGRVGETVSLQSVNPPPGFEAALAAATGDGAAIGYANAVLTAQATSRDASAVTFTVPHAGAGKHTLRLVDGAIGAFLVIPEACVYLTAPLLPADPANIYGVNLAGGEFGNVYDGAGNKVIYGGGRYYYPSRPQTPATAHDQMDYFWSKGVRLMRLPVKWERIQPALFGPLYYGPDEPFTATNDLDMRRIAEVIAYWTGLGGIALFDLHNYMGYQQRLPDGTVRSGKVKYDSPIGLTVEALSDVWVRLADVYGSNPRVWFGLMNEPSGDGATATRTRDNMHAVVNAIRSRTGALNKVLVAGSSYSNAKKWVSGGVADAFDAFYDPARNFAFEPHNYIDPDQSGTQGTCVVQTATISQLADFTTWARSRGFRGLLGEFAGGNPAVTGQEQCGSSVPATYQFMRDNADVWIGWATWAAGFPTSYPFTLEPSGGYAGTDSPGMKMLLPFLGPAPTA